MENMNERKIETPVISTEENLNVDANGNPRTLRTMLDGSIQKLSAAEYATENEAIRENMGDAMRG